jgi:LPXTG-motif cell wall-anchored protein
VSYTFTVTDTPGYGPRFDTGGTLAEADATPTVLANTPGTSNTTALAAGILLAATGAVVLAVNRRKTRTQAHPPR